MKESHVATSYVECSKIVVFFFFFSGHTQHDIATPSMTLSLNLWLHLTSLIPSGLRSKVWSVLRIAVAYLRRCHGVVGDIDVVMGGPPCQGVSGLNRHSATENILKDGRYDRSVLCPMAQQWGLLQPSGVRVSCLLGGLSRGGGVRG